MSFKTFERKIGVGRSAATVSFRADRSVALSGAAFALLNAEPYVQFEIGEHADEGKLAILPSQQGEFGAYETHSAGGQQGAYMNARDLHDAMLAAGYLNPGETRAWPAYFDESLGGLVVNMRVEGTVRRSRRSTKSADEITPGPNAETPPVEDGEDAEAE